MALSTKHQHLTGLSRCPHCGISNPQLLQLWRSDKPVRGAIGSDGYAGRFWSAFKCTSCGLVVMASSPIIYYARTSAGHLTGGISTEKVHEVDTIYPSIYGVDDEIPERAQRYLKQAFETLHAPDGAVMLAASSVDAMLKEKGYETGALYSKINKAVEDGLLTKGMSEWAHQVRLDANDPRHVDKERPHLTSDEARQAVEFARALGEFLFVLPSRVQRGIDNSKKASADADKDGTA